MRDGPHPFEFPALSPKANNQVQVVHLVLPEMWASEPARAAWSVRKGANNRQVGGRIWLRAAVTSLRAPHAGFESLV